MTDKTPDQIEREIEAERGELARSLEELQAKFSPEALVNTATGLFRDHGGAIADNATRQVKQNPLALVVTGVGLAWLIAGPGRKTGQTYDRWSATHGIDAFRDHYGRPEDRDPPRVAYDDRVYASAPGFNPDRDPMTGFDDRLARAEGDWEEPGLRDRVQDRVRGAAQSARDGLASARARVAGTAASLGSDSDGSSGSDKSMLDRLKEGTENMTDAARDRVIAARQRAYEAQRRVEDHARQYASYGREAYGSQPLVGGLIAFGVGALIGAALPRTRREDEYLGVYRDRAMSEAERIYREESSKLQSVARAAADEAKAVASDAIEQVKSGAPSGKEAVDQAEGAAKSAATRVADAAKSEAEKKDLGGSVR
ncbi:DUF3618 domain-containing protein [Jannaschia sp. S6380]|uniref:DUF3618 domain-containing protein n=1 Tax=Jannaschia sp. S6380 TaxID=2926408 RepID=UPI001FF3292E|nr:DUF3618 domain-containing protein [Jannaschia sp. S6380]MCK0168382.1 DUF3618 domain-containing protein [Jannaschia sp. S6380]